MSNMRFREKSIIGGPSISWKKAGVIPVPFVSFSCIALLHLLIIISSLFCE